AQEPAPEPPGGLLQASWAAYQAGNPEQGLSLLQQAEARARAERQPILLAEAWRRQGIARLLLDHAARDAAAQGMSGLALDTGLHNEGARALYRACGFREREVRRAPTPRAERAIGGPGFVAYFRAA
ncbi:MAG TPA: GNAT family N-acetyltransferase, partial [Solirubrobacter sp.]|nr:GNAT family N-acetyltransferase [Solirubrobacter sp.]